MQWPRTKYPGLGPALKQVSGIILFPLKGVWFSPQNAVSTGAVVFSVVQWQSFHILRIWDLIVPLYLYVIFLMWPEEAVALIEGYLRNGRGSLGT